MSDVSETTGRKLFATSTLMMKNKIGGFNYQMVLRVVPAISEDEARGIAVANATELHPEHYMEAVLIAPVLWEA